MSFLIRTPADQIKPYFSEVREGQRGRERVREGRRREGKRKGERVGRSTFKQEKRDHSLSPSLLSFSTGGTNSLHSALSAFSHLGAGLLPL